VSSDVANILDEIVAHKRDEVAAAKARLPQEELQARAAATPRPRNFFRAVTGDRKTMSVIAEIKKASPSAGLIRADFDVERIARAYRDAGAAAISCLTDEKYFQGSLDYIGRIKEAVGLPVLRKDFIIDRYQLYEARAAGADAVLLIAECLKEAQLVDLLILATQLQLTVLLEVHEVDSLLKVRPHVGFPHAGYCLLGINNRDLKTMTTDLNHTLRLVDMVENPKILVSESGIRTHADLQKLWEAGVGAVLVGEHLMKQPDIEAALRELLSGGSSVN
jgi:indole-3-glycerol phosphate synthase